ncbi:hypothetical protein GQ53DRAFT_860833 [Thozetella sp. PMI_491]|nr:hypothetical protein GQ53DRAFT_860833 [Thozetella sp. PMI_491]
MPATTASLEFLADLPLYKTAKPYRIFPALDVPISKESAKLITNMKWDEVPVKIHDIRDEASISLQTCGFQILSHDAPESSSDLNNLTSRAKYMDGVHELIDSIFKPELVVPIESNVRKNMPIDKAAYDVSDILLVEGPPQGAHVDFSAEEAAKVIARHLTSEQQSKYFNGEYRLFLINTWKPLIPVVEDRPLAFCDFRSVKPTDLVAVDKVYPNAALEMYYLKHSSEQQWYWISQQKKDELLMMVMYDSHPKDGACCKYRPRTYPMAFQSAEEECEIWLTVEPG